MARKRLGEILIQAGILDDNGLRSALGEQRRWGGPLGRILVDMKLVTEDAMVAALSQQLNFPTVNLEGRQVPAEALELMPGELAEQHSVLPFNVQGKFVDVAMADPTNLGIIDEMRIRTRLNVRPYLCGPKMLERAIGRLYGRGLSSTLAAAGVPPDYQGSISGERVVDLSATPVRARAEISPAASRRAEAFGMATPNPDGPKSVGAPPALAGMTFPGQGPAGAAAGGGAPAAPLSARAEAERSREISVLQARVQHLEALVARDEDVLRKLLILLIEKGLATREEVLEKIR